jgi:Zn-dependent protease
MTTTSTPAPPLTHCRRCGAPLEPGELFCRNCGLFVHIDELQRLSADALRLEPVNPYAAAEIWRQCLDLLPPDSPQYCTLYDRIGVLNSGLMPAELMPGAGQRPGNVPSYSRAAAAPESFGVALAKTIGSMILSIVVYAAVWHDIEIAVAFCVIILVHEMGHVIANKYYGLSAGPPIFLPFVGAVINLKQRPPNAKVEAIIGIAGPVLGTIGSLVCFWLFLHTGNRLLGACAYFGFMLNLFNLLPVPPLDGGRVTAAVSPWIWALGLLGLVWLFIDDFRTTGSPNIILILVLVYALPRILSTWRGREKFGDYYKISRLASWSIAALYLLLAVVLIYFFQVTTHAGV